MQSIQRRILLAGLPFRRLFDLEDFKAMYKKSGLDLLHVFGNYQLNEFDLENSDRLILISHKP